MQQAINSMCLNVWPYNLGFQMVFSPEINLMYSIALCLPNKYLKD